MEKGEEQRLLEETLNKALDEAWTKVNAALEQVVRASQGYERVVWLAAESVEYASLLFSLTNDLEDEDPPLPSGRTTEILPLVKESVVALQRVRESNHGKKMEDYKNLRTAVQGLRTACLGSLKKPGRQGQSLTRS